MTQRVDSPLLSYHTPGPPRRPTSVLVFGIIGIVIASLAMLRVVLFIARTLMSDIAFLSALRFMSVAASLAFHVALMWVSIGLIGMRPAARMNAVRWAVAYICWTVVESIISLGWMISITSREFGLQSVGWWMMGIVIGVVILCIYPTLLIIFMRRQHIRDAFERASVQPIPVAAIAEPADMPAATSTLSERTTN